MKKILFLLLLSVLSIVQGIAQVNYVERIGNESPFGLPHIFSNYGAPELADIDNDGDYDLLVSSYNTNIVYYENVGTPTSYDFEERTGSDNPFDGIVTMHIIHMTDVDNDNDLDLVLPNHITDSIYYYENTGSEINPNFVQKTGNSNPYNAITSSIIVTYGSWTGDLNNDGFVDYINGIEVYLGNINGFEPPYQQNLSVSEVVDFDNDGDNDLVVTNPNSVPFLHYYRNTGDNTNMNFVYVPNSTFENIKIRKSKANNAAGSLGICLKDIDNDGDDDFLITDSGGSMTLYKRIGPNAFPLLVMEHDFQDFFYGYSASNFINPALVDVNGDSLLDMVLPQTYYYTAQNGINYFNHVYFKNEGGLNAPKFNIQLSQQNDPSGGNPFANTIGLKRVFFRDFDGDNDLDMVNQDYSDDFTYFENTGSTTSPNYQQQSTHYYAVLNNLDVGDFVDIDGDGDFDFLNGNTFRLFQSNTFIPQTNNPINSPNSRLTFVDFDEDGDYDCFAGTNYQILYYKNEGTPTSPNFALSTTDNPFANVVSTVDRPKVVFGDVDIDGDIDMFMSDEYHIDSFPVKRYYYLRYFENQTIYTNTQTTSTSKIQNLIIAPNPNNGQFSVEVPKSLQQRAFNLQIFDLTGRMIVNRLYQNANHQLLMNDLEQYANGLYIVTLQSETERYQAKVLKQ